MKFSNAFDDAIKKFRISAKHLSEQSGIFPQSISEFRRNKKSIQVDSLEKLLEYLPIEARMYFFSLLLGEGISAERLIAGMNEDQMADLMLAIANKMKNSHQKNDDSQNTN